MTSENYKITMIKEFQQSFREYFKEYYLNNTTESNTHEFVEKWSKCRVDIKNNGDENNSLEFLSSKNMSVNFPKWLKNNRGEGCVIQSKHNKLNITFKTIKEGKLQVILRGVNYISKFNSKIPIYLNYKKLIVNNKIIFLENKIITHDKPFKYSLDCEDGQLLNIEIEFETIFDYLPDLEDYVKKFDEQLTLDNFNEFDNYLNMGIIENSDENCLNTLNVINQLNNKLNDMYFENKKLNNELLSAKKDYDNILDSYNKQFSTIFLDYELHPRGILKYTQELCIELLNFVVKICKKYDLKYWLDFGTLLGAIRHKGFIPWDDDIDIAMLRKDFDIFVSIINKEIKDSHLDDVITVNIDKTFKGTLISFVQIKYSADSRYLFAGLDIFPYDFKVNKEENIVEKYFVEQQKFRKLLKQGKNRSDLIKECFKNLNLSWDNEEYIIPGLDNTRGKYQRYSFDILKTNKILPLTELTFCGEKYSAPKDPDYYLKSIYKNYYNMPQIIEVHRRVNDLKKNPENEKLFKSEIEKMKRINEKYD